MTPETTEPLRVLVIDDNPSHTEVVVEGLERVGYVCTVAHSGTGSVSSSSIVPVRRSSAHNRMAIAGTRKR